VAGTGGGSDWNLLPDGDKRFSHRKRRGEKERVRYVAIPNSINVVLIIGIKKCCNSRWQMAGGEWWVVGGRWWVVGAQRQVAGGWWLVAGGWWGVQVADGRRLVQTVYGGRNGDISQYHSLNLIICATTTTRSHDASLSW
jgi:hypothetical protein